MDEDTRTATRSFNWQWPAIISVVVAILLGIQLLRVNKRDEPGAPSAAPVTYSTPGPVLSGDLKVGSGEFLATQITLNRRAKLSGEFQTGSVKNRVAIVVVDEENFEKWKAQTEFKSRAGTGYVPGGKISPTLDPGTYFLIVDNRSNPDPTPVRADFMLE